jgi:hypothetical protein
LEDPRPSQEGISGQMGPNEKNPPALGEQAKGNF